MKGTWNLLLLTSLIFSGCEWISKAKHAFAKSKTESKSTAAAIKEEKATENPTPPSQSNTSNRSSILDNSKNDVPEIVSKIFLGGSSEMLLKSTPELNPGKDDEECKKAESCQRYFGVKQGNKFGIAWLAYTKNDRVFYYQKKYGFKRSSFTDGDATPLVSDIVGKSARAPDSIVNSDTYRKGQEKIDGVTQMAIWAYRDGYVRVSGVATNYRQGRPLPFFSDYHVTSIRVSLCDQRYSKTLDDLCTESASASIYENKYNGSDQNVEYGGD